MNGLALWMTVAAVLMAAAQFGVTTGRLPVAAVMVSIGLGATLSARRWRFGSAGEVLLVLALGIGGVVVHGLDPQQMGSATAPLRSAMFVFGFAGLGAAAVRLHLDRPEGGAPVTLAAAGVVFLACGSVRTGAWLPRLFAAYLLFALLALAADAWQRGHAPAPWRSRGRHLWVSLALLLAVPLTMAAWASAGPRLIRSGTSYLLDRLGPSHGTGFRDGPITLHALDGLLDSDEVVLRIDGASPSYLRGNVYVHYTRGRWQPPEPDAEPSEVALAIEPGAPGMASRIEYVAGDHDRFFLPIGARPHALEPETASVDAWRIVRAGEGAPEAAVFRWPADRVATPAAPSRDDLELPVGTQEALWAAAQRLAPPTHDSVADEARRLASALASRFSYSLEFRDAFTRAQRARPGVDPVVIFLEDAREGHCEYFASALTLMLRARHIPARFVTGYRVGERNPIGDYAIVRERHAHAWVEAYLPDEGWVTLDGTPMAATMPGGLDETPRVAAVFDWLMREARRHGQRLLLVVLVVGLASAQIVRLWRGRRGAAGESARARRRTARALRQLLERLAEAGFDRAPSESLESLARRLRAGSSDAEAASLVSTSAVASAAAAGSKDAVASAAAAGSKDAVASSVEVRPGVPIVPALVEAAELLDRYAAHRYGDVGDWGRLEGELAVWPGAAPEDDARPD